MSENLQVSPAHGSADSNTMDLLARAMPLVLSTFMHVGVALVVLFLGIMVISRPPAAQSAPAQVYDVAPSPPVAFPDTQQPLAQRQQGGGTLKARSEELVLFTVKTDTSKRLFAPKAADADWRSHGPHPLARFTDCAPPVRAHHVVFLIDCSGSMIPVFDQLRLMMLKSIGELDANRQDFHVILFSTGKPIEGPARRLVPPTRGYKLAACEFLTNVHPRGLTDPLPAMRRAFDVMAKADARPGKVIWLLTDSEFPDSKKVLDLARARNADKGVTICTFLYGNREAAAEGVMRRIAVENGGEYKFISSE